MQTIQLSRAYICVFGQPVIAAVDPAIFRLRYFAHCLKCNFCHQQCCSYGVDVDRANLERLREYRPELEAMMGTPFETWFTGEWIDDTEYPGGGNTRTAVVDERCVFLDRGNGLCRLHGFALGQGVEYQRLKPFMSILFPLTFAGGVLMASEEIEEGSLACVGDGPTAYDGVRGELAWYFGEEMVAELDAIKLREHRAQPAPAPAVRAGVPDR